MATGLDREGLDRCPVLREDADWMQARLQDASSRFLVVQSEQIDFLADGVGQPVALLRANLKPEAMPVFLGAHEGACYFFVLADEVQEFDPALRFRPLFEVAPEISLAWLEMLFLTRALLLWENTHRYCGACGAPTEKNFSGWMRTCTQCQREIYPRVDPAIIVMVTHEDRALLVNKPSWPESRRSVIAGYVDPAETMEDAVRREVFEESGVRIGTVRYHTSQPWPFPGSLMLACIAEAIDPNIDTDSYPELRCAEWYSRDELNAAVQAGEVDLPFARAVSRELIDFWLHQ